MINQCTQLLSPSADPTYVMTYISHSFPLHRQYLCAGAWTLMHGHAENINSANLVKFQRFFLQSTKQFFLSFWQCLKLSLSLSLIGMCVKRNFSRRSHSKYIHNGGCASASYSFGATAWSFGAGFVFYFLRDIFFIHIF